MEGKNGSMITRSEVREISNRLFLESAGEPENDLSEDISCIVYCIDVCKVGNDAIISRHIDIEYCFGDYYEVCEGTSLFQFISTLHDLPLLQEEQEIVIYQREDSEAND